jgi:hypothetical protein
MVRLDTVITTALLHENRLRHVTSALVQQTSLQLVIGLVKTYGLAKEGPQNHLQNQDKENIKI